MGDWIPVQQKMPCDGDLVLVTICGRVGANITLDHTLALARHWSDEGVWDIEYIGDMREFHLDVLAWMELPEPYDWKEVVKTWTERLK